MSFAAVVVLHRSRNDLATLLASFRPPQLIVVDAGPDDGGADLAREHGATVVERRDNPGFGAANNVGLAQVTQPVTVLLNPDTEDTHGDIARLARRAQAGEALQNGLARQIKSPSNPRQARRPLGLARLGGYEGLLGLADARHELAEAGGM